MSTRIVELTRALPTVPGDAERNGAFGAALVAADFDGDGFDDLAIGVPAATVAGRRGAGDVVVLYGGPGGLAGAADARADVLSAASPFVPGNPEAGDAFGRVLAAGDVTGDGRPDLVVGLPDKNLGPVLAAGQVLLVPAGPRGLDLRLTAEIRAGMLPLGAAAEARQRLGRSLAVADLNGDGVADLAIGAVGQSHAGRPEAGVLIVGWGYSADLPGVPTATVRPPTNTPTATRTATPRPTATALPLTHIYLPYSARIALLGRYPPVP